MVTKVRGDKIKEGSIPLSALSNDVKYVTGSYNVEAVFNAAGTYPFNFADYYFCKVGNKFVSLSGIGDGRSIQIFDGPPIYIKYEYNGRYSTCVITDVSGYISKERPVEIVTINKSNSLFLPDGIGGADWNAQEGEAGYIENRTHYNSENTILQKINDKDLGEINIKGYDRIHIIYDYKNGETDYIIIDVKNQYIIDSTLENWKNGYVDYYFNDDSFSLYIDGYDYDVLPNINVIGYITKQLDEVYIPDTIARKSEVQGIDPVVWKYICNPLPISDYNNCPKELLDEEGNLKYQIRSMYIVHYNGEYYGPISWIDKRCMGTFYNNGSCFEVILDDDGYFRVAEMTN